MNARLLPSSPSAHVCAHDVILSYGIARGFHSAGWRRYLLLGCSSRRRRLPARWCCMLWLWPVRRRHRRAAWAYSVIEINVAQAPSIGRKRATVPREFRLLVATPATEIVKCAALARRLFQACPSACEGSMGEAEPKIRRGPAPVISGACSRIGVAARAVALSSK